MRSGIATVILSAVVSTGTCAATAQEWPSTPAGNFSHPARDYGVAGVLFFNLIAVGNDDSDSVSASANKVKAITRVDDATAHKFIVYANDALKTLNDEAPQRNREFCEKRAEMNTISRLAMAMSEADAKHEQRRAQLVRGAESVLGRDGMLKLETYLSTKDLDKKRVSQDYVARLQERNESPEEVLTLICNRK